MYMIFARHTEIENNRTSLNERSTVSKQQIYYQNNLLEDVLNYALKDPISLFSR